MAERKGRSTVYNKIVTEEKWANVNKKNKQLMEDFLSYLISIDRSQTTVDAYRNDLRIFLTQVADMCDNKYFIDLKKRDISRWQAHVSEELGWSPKRVRRVKSAVSSMSNYIENILSDDDEEFEDYRPIVRKIESPTNVAVREKTVLSDEQVDDLLSHLVKDKKYRVACAVALAVFSGARKMELTRFKVSYFNEENLQFGAFYKTPEKIKTKGRGRKLGKQLNKYILKDFKPYLDLWMKEREELGIDSEWLFVTKEDDNWIQAKGSTMDSYASTCDRYLEEPFYFHCLRHQLCSRLNRYNLPSNIIQEYFGWSSRDLIDLYDDNEASDDFGKYFTSEGIVKQEEKALSDL